MMDTNLYLRMLGLSAPWFVADVELDTTGGQVDAPIDSSRRAKGSRCGS